MSGENQTNHKPTLVRMVEQLRKRVRELEAESAELRAKVKFWEGNNYPSEEAEEDDPP